LLTFGNHGAALKVPRWNNDVVQKVLAHADPKDAINTFNMSIGWVAIVAAADADKALSCGAGAIVLGEIDGSGHVTVEVAA
jgi:phosphoribosylformylglycinamidine cyclo-ligase